MPENNDARFLALAAICLGLSFSWLAPCLIAVGLDRQLPQILFVSWSIFAGLGGVFVVAALFQRWSRP